MDGWLDGRITKKKKVKKAPSTKHSSVAYYPERRVLSEKWGDRMGTRAGGIGGINALERERDDLSSALCDGTLVIDSFNGTGFAGNGK